MRSEGDEKGERYSSGGIVSGVTGLVAIVAVLAYGVLDEGADLASWVYPGLLLAAGLIWAVLLRPAVVLHPEELELRNVFHSRWIPYGRIDSLAIDQVTRVEVDERRYVGSGFGRARLAINRDAQAGPNAPSDRRSLGWLVEEKIRRRMSSERTALPTGSRAAIGEPAPVRRTWAVPEVAVVSVLAVVTLVLALLG